MELTNLCTKIIAESDDCFGSFLLPEVCQWCEDENEDTNLLLQASDEF